MVTKRLPQVGVIDQCHILSRLPVGQSIAGNFSLAASPTLVAGAIEIHFAIDNAVATIEVTLNSAIWINDATATAKLYSALATVAIGCNKIHPIFKCACHPPATRAFFFQPVGWEQ